MVGGQLRFFLPAWIQSCSGVWVLDIVREGHRIKVSEPPLDSGIHPAPWPSCWANRSELSLEVESLLKKGAIQEVSPLEVGRGFTP